MVKKGDTVWFIDPKGVERMGTAMEPYDHHLGRRVLISCLDGRTFIKAVDDVRVVE